MAERRPALRLLVAISTIAAIWYGFLATIAVLTANPIQLNALQILRSRWVVIASVNHDGNVEVRKAIVGVLPDVPIRLTPPLPPTSIEIILPLIREFGDIRVTPTNLPQGDRLTYPATEGTVAQLEKILNSKE